MMRKLPLLFLLAATAASCAAPALAAETIGYGYDARGRLVTVVRTGPVNKATRYALDKADNRTVKTVTGRAALLLFVPLNDLTPIPINPE